MICFVYKCNFSRYRTHVSASALFCQVADALDHVQYLKNVTRHFLMYISFVFRKYWHTITWFWIQIYFTYFAKKFPKFSFSNWLQKYVFFPAFMPPFLLPSTKHQRFIYIYLPIYLSVLHTYFIQRSFQTRNQYMFLLDKKIFVLYVFLNCVIYYK